MQLGTKTPKRQEKNGGFRHLERNGITDVGMQALYPELEEQENSAGQKKGMILFPRFCFGKGDRFFIHIDLQQRCILNAKIMTQICRGYLYQKKTPGQKSRSKKEWNRFSYSFIILTIDVIVNIYYVYI